MRRVMCQRTTKPDVRQPSWFKDRVAEYISDLAAQHYKKKTLHDYERSLLRFGEFVEGGVKSFL